MSDSTVPPKLNDEHQKLVTIYLDNTAYTAGKTFVGTFGDKHALIEEHLAQYLSSGWKISNLQACGGGSDSLAVRGWIIVLLERT